MIGRGEEGKDRRQTGLTDWIRIREREGEDGMIAMVRGRRGMLGGDIYAS